MVAPSKEIAMGDWSAEDLSKAIERRRGRPRRASGIVRDAPSQPVTEWSQRDWASRFTFETGYRAHVRGVTQVCVRDTDGEIMWEGGVRELELHAEPWLGYAWFVHSGDKVRFATAVQGEAIHSAEDAVRAQL
jgi:hypothetical protein